MKEKGHITAVTMLTRQEIDFLDKLGKDAHFEYGHKLSRGVILAELVKLLMRLGIKVKDINLKKESLSEGIVRLINHGQKELSI